MKLDFQFDLSSFNEAFIESLNLDELKGTILEKLTGIKDSLIGDLSSVSPSDLGEALLGNLQDQLGEITGMTDELKGTILEKLTGIKDSLIGDLSSVSPSDLGEALLGSLQDQLGDITGMTDELKGTILEKLTGIKDSLIGDLSSVSPSDLGEALLGNLQDQLGNITDIADESIDNIFRGISGIFDSIAEESESKLQKTIDIASSAVGALSGVWSAYYDVQSSEIDDWYANQKEAIENSTKSEEEKKIALEELDEEYAEKQRELAEKQKPMQIAQAISGTAMAVINALQTQPFIPLGLIAAATAAAQGAIQIATIKAQKYAAGVIEIRGPGTDTSDSILALLSRGESVINADGTRKNKAALQYANAGGVIPGFSEEELKVSNGIMESGILRADSHKLKLMREQNKILKEQNVYLQQLKDIRSDMSSMRKARRRF